MKICFLIALVLLTGSAQAATLIVCPSGCEYSSIQAAIDAASPGDTVEVLSGTYEERVIPHNAVTILLVDTGGGAPRITGDIVINVNGVNVIPLNRSAQSDRQPAKEVVAKATTAQKLLYSDDFSDANSGWATGPPSQISWTGYKNGKYQIEVFQQGKYTSVCKLREFTDFVMEVEAAIDKGYSNAYGVILRQVDKDNFYRFKVSGLGAYGFDKMQNGDWVDIIPWSRSNAIHGGKATNLIKVECKGDKFQFYVNGIELRECTDDSFNSGHIGIEAERFDEEGLQVSFDNLNVWDL